MPAPRATYRLQLTPRHGFDHAIRVMPHLAALGISHLYLSPIFEARSGSSHGYDVTDPTRVREALGGRAGFERLVAHSAQAGIGILLDIVPNHMAASSENPWWWDLLEHGPDSVYRGYFDVRRTDDGGFMRIGLPILGEPLDTVLARGELELHVDDEPWIGYHEHRLPLAPATRASAPTAARTRAGLERLLGSQHYELMLWREFEEKVPYRRFFDITHLIGLRAEDPEVFGATHALLRELMRAGAVDGVRVDHIDGMRDPHAYLTLLERAIGEETGRAPWILVEKILAGEETVPDDWPVAGTTGYDFTRVAGGWFIDPDGHARLRSTWHATVPGAPEFALLVRRKKRLVVDRLFAGELRLLAERLRLLIGSEPPPLDALAGAIREVAVALDVYRTYVRGARFDRRDRQLIDAALASAAESGACDAASLSALAAVLRLDLEPHTPERRRAALAFVLDWQQFTGPVMAKGYEDTALYCDHALLAANEVGGDPDAPATTTDTLHAFLHRRTHTPGTLNATSTHDSKRSEDVRRRLTVLARDPGAWDDLVRSWLSSGAVQRCSQLDVRAELLLLQTLVGTWPVDASPDDAYARRIRDYMVKAARESKLRTSWRDPDPHYEAALEERVDRVLSNTNDPPVRALTALVDRIAFPGALDALAMTALKTAAPGVADFYQGTERWHFALVDPDNRRPVDYHSTQRVRARIDPVAAHPAPGPVGELLRSWRDGAVKTLVTAAGLHLRRDFEHVFSRGEYVPLPVHGERSTHVFAFARGSPGQSLVCVLARWLLGHVTDGRMPPPEFWSGATIGLTPHADAGWYDALSGAHHRTSDGQLPVADILRVLPCAVLVGQ